MAILPAAPAGLASPSIPVPALVRRSRGVAYNAQGSYANWQRGVNSKFRADLARED